MLDIKVETIISLLLISKYLGIRETDRNPQSGRPTATLCNILAKGKSIQIKLFNWKMPNYNLRIK